MSDEELEKIDQEVHVKVMGGIVRHVRARGSDRMVAVCNQALVDGAWNENELRFYGDVPAYTAMIEVSWDVVDKMQGDGWSLRLTSLGEGKLWRAEFTCPFGTCPRHGNTKDNWHGSQEDADSAPLAICLAALKAVSTKET